MYVHIPLCCSPQTNLPPAKAYNDNTDMYVYHLGPVAMVFYPGDEFAHRVNIDLLPDRGLNPIDTTLTQRSSIPCRIYSLLPFYIFFFVSLFGLTRGDESAD